MSYFKSTAPTDILKHELKLREVIADMELFYK